MKVHFPFPRCSLAALALMSLCAGCASTPDDPFEGYNRAMFKVNEHIDRAVVKPVAQAYTKVTPQPVRVWVSNIFGNFSDPWISANNLLQGKPADALSDLMRFLVNSTLGIGGMLDIASEAGLPKHDEDLGQTLAVWGVGDGPYIVLPFFGSRTLRDAVVLPLDVTADDSWVITAHTATRNSLAILQLVNERARLLGLDRTLEEATLDKYRYTRDFYLQQRRYKVYDGNPPLRYDDYDAEVSMLSMGRGELAAAMAARLELIGIGGAEALARLELGVKK
ncbi:MAG: VacJ family lipoprotein [Azoarcus sp.]|jgi:phospholipid-binding lipoprotein MlaA|nr:VacJ family lipoprotein [Azoarcus sp.]